MPKSVNGSFYQNKDVIESSFEIPKNKSIKNEKSD